MLFPSVSVLDEIADFARIVRVVTNVNALSVDHECFADHRAARCQADSASSLSWSRAHRIDLAGESIATQSLLPLHRSSGSTRERDGAWAVVLSAADGGRIRIIGEVATDIAGIELDGVNAVVHVDPGIPGRTCHGRIGIRATKDTAVAAL